VGCKIDPAVLVPRGSGIGPAKSIGNGLRCIIGFGIGAGGNVRATGPRGLGGFGNPSIALRRTLPSDRRAAMGRFRTFALRSKAQG
jgi:hypothetical protein